MLFNPSRPRTRAKRLSSTNLILIGGEILRGLSFCLVVVLLASAIALTGTSSGIGQRDRGREQRSEEHTSELQSRGHLACRLVQLKNIGGTLKTPTLVAVLPSML